MGYGMDESIDFDEPDHYEEGLAMGEWMQRNGGVKNVTDMTTSHIRNARRYAVAAMETARDTHTESVFSDWVDTFDEALAERSRKRIGAIPARLAPVKRKHEIRGARVRVRCHCGSEYSAREADIKRGWGLSCSKRCAAIRREFGRPAAKPVSAGKGGE